MVLLKHRGGMKPLAKFLRLTDSGGCSCRSASRRFLETVRTDKGPHSIDKLVGQTRPIQPWSSLRRNALIRQPGLSLVKFVRVTAFKVSDDGSTSAQQDSCCIEAEPARYGERRSDAAPCKEALMIHSHSAIGARSNSTRMPGSPTAARSFGTWECSPGAQASLFAHHGTLLPASPTGGKVPTSTGVVRRSAAFLASSDVAVADSPVRVRFSMLKLYLFDQRRYVRPNRGRNDYQRVGGKRRGRGVEALPETLDLLLKTQDAEATPAVIRGGSDCLSGLPRATRPSVPVTEAMAVPTVADVNAPLPVQRSWTSSVSRRARLSTQQDTHFVHGSLNTGSCGEQGFPQSYSTESTGGLSSVALHIGDVSRLRVDATLFGALPSLKIVGSGRGFVGCSSLISGAGPMLPTFVSQQRNAFINSGSRSRTSDSVLGAPANAAVAVAALREGIARLVKLCSQSLLKTSFDRISAEDVPKLPAATLSAVAASAGRHFLACHKEGTAGSDAHALRGGSTPGVVSPASLLPPGAVILSPGFSLPSAFLVHVVEPNAIYSSEHFFRALTRLEELEATQRRNGRATAFRGSVQNGEDDSQEVDDKAGKRLCRCCWERMRLLEDCYVKALNAAAALGVQSVAVPCLGAGAGRYPAYVAARCAAKAVGRWMKGQLMTERKGGVEDAVPGGRTHPVIERVVFCTTSDQEWKALRHLIPAFFAW